MNILRAGLCSFFDMWDGCYFTGVVMLKKLDPCFFHNISLWGKVFLGPGASREVVMAPFDHYKGWLHSPALFLGARFKVVIS